MILFFGVRLRWLPTGGRGPVSHLVLPATVLAFIPLPLTVRLTRASMLEVLGRGATSARPGPRGWPSGGLVRHALRNALLPVVTILGVQFGRLLGGSVVTETVFAWPGVGRLIVTPSSPGTSRWSRARSWSWPRGGGVNFAVDPLYGLLDPRVARAS